MRENFWAYIATNKTHTMPYTGVTNDLERRMWEHKYNTNPKSFTARYKPGWFGARTSTLRRMQSRAKNA